MINYPGYWVLRRVMLFDQKLPLKKRPTEDDDAASEPIPEYRLSLLFNLNPVEVKVENDSIDFEMRIVEGSQATINSIGHQRKYQDQRTRCPP